MFEDTNYTFVKCYGNNIYHRYKEGDQTVNSVVRDFQPSTYNISDRREGYESVYGENLSRDLHHSVESCKSFVKQFEEVNNFKLYGTSDYGLQFVTEKYGKKIDFDHKLLRGCYYDIEVESDDGFPEPEQADYPIISICAFDTFTKVYYVFGSNEYEHDENDKEVGHLKVKHIRFNSEEELILAFIHFIDGRNFDYLSGWFTSGFDDPYVVHRASRVLGETAIKKLSPFGIVRMQFRPGAFGVETLKAEIFGLEQLDYQELYKKNVFEQRENYSLDYIANVELGSRKISYDEHKDLNDLYRNDYNKFIRYNIKDTDLVVRIEEKRKLISLVYTQAYLCKCNPSTTLATVMPWEALTYSNNFYDNKLELFKKKKGTKVDFAGGFVFDVQKGKHKWVLSVDLDSLYPHIEMQYNIGPETYVKPENLPQELKDIRDKYYHDEHAVDKLVNKEIDLSALKKYNYSMTAAFEFYSNEKMSFFSKIKREL